MRAFKALLVAAGVFLAVEAVYFVIGLVVMLATQHTDPNGITSTADPASQASVAAWGNFVTLAGIALGLVAGIVYGVRPQPPRSSRESDQ